MRGMANALAIEAKEAMMANTETGRVHARPGHELEYHAREAYQVLHWGFVLAPFLAGLDKFFDLLTHWEKYLSPAVTHTLSISAHSFMILVGLLEIVAALIVAFRPRIGAFVVGAWLAAIIVNLIVVGGYLDVALRDLGLLLGALALGLLARSFDHVEQKLAQSSRPVMAKN